MRFNYKHNIHNIPLKVRLGCTGVFLALIFILIILFVGFFKVMSFLLESWLGIFFIGLIIVYLIYKKLNLNLNSTKKQSNNNFTDAEYIEIDDNEENKD